MLYIIIRIYIQPIISKVDPPSTSATFGIILKQQFFICYINLYILTINFIIPFWKFSYLIFRKLKFRKGKFSYNFICTKIFQDDILSLQFFCTFYKERSRARWRSSEETVVFEATTYTATTYTKRYGGRSEAIGEELECDREPENSFDHYGVCVG